MKKIIYTTPLDVGIRYLDPGTRSVLARFERAVIDFTQAKLDEDELEAAKLTIKSYRDAKRAFIRHLLRKQGVLPPSKQGRKRGER